MIFKKLTIQNFMSIRSISLDLQDRGLVLIKGKNCDNPDLNNNGSGKSSMIEAFVYALYGRTLRGVKGDSVVHKIPKKNMKIFLDLTDDDGTEYRIARYRKHSVNKNKSLLYRNGKDITPKSETDFNNYIADLLQADYLTFTSSLLYSAESFRFTSATDAEMKSTFDMMLGLNVFSKCLEIAKIRLKAVENDLSTTQWKIDDRKSKIDSLKDKIEEALQQREEYAEQQEQKQDELVDLLEVLDKELKQRQNELKQLEKQLAQAEKSKDKAQKDLDAKKKKLKQLDDLQSELANVKSDITDCEQDIKKAKSNIETSEENVLLYQKKIEKLQKKIETLNQQKSELDKDIGQPCPTCGQPMTAESIEPAKKEYDEQIGDVEEEIQKYQKKIEKEQENAKKCGLDTQQSEIQLQELRETFDEFQALLDKSQDLYDERDKAAEVLENAQEVFYDVKSQVKTKNGEITQVNERIKSALSDLEKCEDAENPYDKMVEKYEKDKEVAAEEIVEFEASIQDKLDEQKCLQFWQQAYSNQGIKSLILDDITPFLNRRVNKYLQKLTSGHIEVKFSTQTLLKSGEMREKFSIDILNQDGGSEYIANSGGEKKRIDLCINLALQDLVASRSTKRINIAIWDEVFDALDETGIEKVIELLQELSEEKSTILVVSHNPHLQSYFSNIITVVKKDGYSTLLDGEITEDDGE